METQSRIYGNTRLLLILLVILGMLAALDDYPGWRFLFLGLVGAWWLSYRWARSLAKNLQLRREMRFGWAQVGDQLEERFTLENKGSFPGLWLELQDHSDLPGYQASMVTGIDSAGASQWRAHGRCIRRGLYTLGPTTLRTSDPLGLYKVELHDPNSVTLMVTPPIVPLPEIDVAPGGRSGEGRPRPNAPELTVSAAGVREYFPGDSLRHVHWPTTARRDEYYIRLFDSTPSGDWWIILDVDCRVQAGQNANSTEEHGIILAASLADRGLRLGRAVGLVAFGAPLVWLPPREGDGQRWEILRALAVLSPSQHPLGELLAGVKPTLGRFTSLVIITPNTSGEWLEGLLPLMWGGAMPTVVLLDPASFGGEGDCTGLMGSLSEWGIQYHRITPDLLDRPEARPGKKGQWGWRISPTGRAIPAARQRDISWKTLA